MRNIEVVFYQSMLAWHCMEKKKLAARTFIHDRHFFKAQVVAVVIAFFFEPFLTSITELQNFIQ